MTNLFDRLAHGFLADRDRPCFLLPGKNSVSYAEVRDRVGRLAAHLIALDVMPGDRVAAQTDKSVEAVLLYLAVLKAGGVYLPLNTAYTASELGYFISDAAPKVVVRDAAAFEGEAEGRTPLAETVPRSDSDLASIIYTSGTTGRSKGAMLTHGNLFANARSLTDAWAFTSSDVLIHALPIFHVHGLFVALHCVFLSGSAMIWLSRFHDAEVLAAMPSATVLMGVPTFYTRLIANPGLTREVSSHMRLFICGSAPLLESVFDDFEARTGHRILERYGMSEAAIITSNPLHGDRFAGSVGYPLPGVDLRIAGEGIGGIEIRGPSVFSGYWENPEKSAESFTADGFFITGDVGRRDPDGRLWISGREKDLIITGGYNVYPKEVEEVLDGLVGVFESAVIGVPHADFGEAVVAVVHGQGHESDIIAQARDKLAAYKAPKRVMFVDSLPRNALGKVQKNVLRAEHEALFAGPAVGSIEEAS